MRKYRFKRKRKDKGKVQDMGKDTGMGKDQGKENSNSGSGGNISEESIKRMKEEKMQVYVRLGIRFLYNVQSSLPVVLPNLPLIVHRVLGRNESNGRRAWYVHPCYQNYVVLRLLTCGCVLARRPPKSLSIEQGIKYDASESALDIPTFIEFHRLKVDEILYLLDSFSAFSFYNTYLILTRM